LGIGTSSPAQLLDVNGTIQLNNTITSPGNFNFDCDTNGNGGRAYKFKYNGTERMRIDSSGRVTTPSQPSFSAYTTSSSATYTNQVIGFNAISTHNTGNHYSTSTYRFTAPVTGTYLFTYNAQKSGSGNTETQFQRNGVKIYDTHVVHTSSGGHGHQSVVWYLSANDYVDVKVVSGTISGDYSHFSGCLIG